MRFRQLCVVLTPDEGIRYFANHDPLLVTTGAPMTLNLNLQNGPAKDSAVLRICQRCGVVYLDSHAKTFAHPPPQQPPPQPPPDQSGGGGEVH